MRARRSGNEYAGYSKCLEIITTYVLAWEVLDELAVLEHLPDDLEGSRHHIVSDVDSAMRLLACYSTSR